ncbi:MAG: ATP-dependent dethiobiotin synthetase BioD [Lentisphaeria bacterium]|nr:ATP-dependent dethiobiotin synthetase BioD [Lentisphaeria bacterium]
MGQVFFVSGIDTGVGKTVVTGLMARYLMKRGVKTATVKIVQTGNTGFSEDRDEHRRIMGTTLPEDAENLTAPQIFSFPASPHLAAALEKRSVDTDRIRTACRTLAARYDVVLAEGAGGLAAPLTEDLLTVDFAAREGYPLILVSSGKLGSLNHTILSLECASSRGMRAAGIVFNHAPGSDPVIDADSMKMMRRYLVRYGFPPAVVRVPEVGETFPEVDFSPLFTEKDEYAHEN